MADSKEAKPKELLETGMAAGLSLATASPAPLIAYTVPRFYDWIRRISGARAEKFWVGFIKGCKGKEYKNIVNEIDRAIENNSEVADFILAAARELINASCSEAIPILGYIKGVVCSTNEPPDELVRGLTQMLLECGAPEELAAIREFAARIVSLQVNNRFDLAVETDYHAERKRYEQHVDIVDLKDPSGTRKGVLGAKWRANRLWRRVNFLLTSNDLALDGTRTKTKEIIVTKGRFLRIHGLIRRREIAKVKYETVWQNAGGWGVLEVVEIPGCFGYGNNEKDAEEMLKKTLRMFIEDYKTAEIIRVQPDSDPRI